MRLRLARVLLRALPALVVMSALVVPPALGGEFAVLSTGFRIHADRHECVGETVRLHSDGGIIELPAAYVVAFEAEEEIPETPPATAGELPAVARSPRELLDEAAERYAVPAEILHSVAAIESSYREDAVSIKGAIGVMQLMPGTAAELNADPHNTEENIDAGARHLRDLLLLYDGGLYRTLAAYNAGAGAVSKYNGIPPYRETQQYIERVLARLQKLTTSTPTDD